MKYIILTLLLSSLGAHAQQMTYRQWQGEVQKDDALVPEFGNKARTKEQKAADKAYIKKMAEDAHLSRRAASEQVVEEGFRYLSGNDLKDAMRRFNQAWILDPHNANTYLGFGSVYFALQQYSMSVYYYDKGLNIAPKDDNLLTYEARSYLAMYETTTDTMAYYKTFPLLKKSYNVNPRNPYTTYMLSRFYLRANVCDSAIKYYHICKKQGGQALTPQFEKGIKARCNIR